jgi:hypothetical protein
VKIGLHGGDCCGVKHIYGLGYYPNVMISARKGSVMTSYGQGWSDGTNDMMHRNRKGKCDFFNLAAPKETYAERFNRFVQFIKDNRLHGIIEVILNPTMKAWIPIIEDLGFKAVTLGKNSNTNLTITIYHLVY